MIYIYIYTWTKQKDSIRIRIHRIFEDSNRKFDGRKSPQLIEDRRIYAYYIRTSKEDSPSPSEYSTIQIARNFISKEI